MVVKLQAALPDDIDAEIKARFGGNATDAAGQGGETAPPAEPAPEDAPAAETP